MASLKTQLWWDNNQAHLLGEGNGTPLQYSCLENPRDGGAWWAAVYGVAQSRTRLKRLSSSSICSGKRAEATRGSSRPAHAQNQLRLPRVLGNFRRLPAAEWLVPPVGFPRRAREAGPAGQDGVVAGPEARAAAGQRPRWPPRLSSSFVQVGGQPCSWLLTLDLPWLVSWKWVRAWVTLEHPQLFSRTTGQVSLASPGRKSVPGSPGDGIKAGCRDRSVT